MTTLISESKEIAVEYRYILAEMLSGELLAELPFVDVSYSRTLDDAGSFSGSFPITEAIEKQDIYNVTMPGRTALYVLRNGQCIWGGMVTVRTYNAKERKLQISADEFVSYLDRRVLWKTWSKTYTANVDVTDMVIGGKTIRVGKVTLDGGEKVPVAAGERVRMSYTGTRVIASSTEGEQPTKEDYAKYNAYHTVLADPAPAADGSFFYFAAYYQPDGQKNYRPIPLQSIDSAYVTYKQSAQEFIQEIKDELDVDFLGLEIGSQFLEPGSREYFEVAFYSRTNNVATITTTQPHRLAPGQMVKIRDVASGFNTPGGEYTEVLETFEDDDNDTLGNKKFTYASTGPDVASTPATKYTSPIVRFFRFDNIVTIETQFNHNVNAGDIVYIEDVKQQFDDKFFPVLRVGTSSGPDPKLFQFYWEGEKINSSPAPSGATFSRIPVVQKLSAGPFVQNADIGITFENPEGISTARAYQDVIRGHELTTIKEIIDKFSDDLVGFNYRIDCSYNQTTDTFSKKLVFLSLRPKSLSDAIAGLPGGVLPANKLPELSYFNADGRVFEYPGNISNVSFVETIEEAGTRLWLIGDNEEQAAVEGTPALPYGVAADHVLLKEGWPLLDRVIKKEKIYNKRDLYRLAKLEISRSQPPVSTFSIDVNGSITPDVSTYKPGDWCVVVIDDPFIQQRLSNYIETKNAENPRNVFLRKINGFTVDVPNNPALPETVSIELTTEPSVDIVGRESWRWDDKEDDDLLDQAQGV